MPDCNVGHLWRREPGALLRNRARRPFIGDVIAPRADDATHVEQLGGGGDLDLQRRRAGWRVLCHLCGWPDQPLPPDLPARRPDWFADLRESQVSQGTCDQLRGPSAARPGSRGPAARIVAQSLRRWSHRGGR